MASELDPFTAYLVDRSVTTELRERIETLTRNITRQTESAESHEKQAAQERAVVVETERLREEYRAALRKLER